MKIQLIVVQGRPEGKVIPLVGPKFKIGRGETCHLRPNSEQVSREHAEFSITGETVAVSDLGSRNGTLVNGKAITEQCTLKDRDLVQVGPLTFAVSIQGGTAPSPAAGVPAASKPTPAPSSKAAPEDVDNDDIEAWLIADSKNAAPERPSGVYSGDTMTINAFKDATNPKSKPKPEPEPEPEPEPVEESDDEYERQGDDDEGDSDAAAEAESADEIPEEFVDESNPFYVKKKPAADPKTPAKPEFKDTSDAASDILRKMMERRRSSKS